MTEDRTSAAEPGAATPIERLKAHVRAMGELAVEMVRHGTLALLDADRAEAVAAISRDEELDRFDVEIETETMRLIAILQPEGPDLRTLGAVLKIATCVDRVGRLGYDLAQYVTGAAPPGEESHRTLLRRMDERARSMVAQALEAFVRNDPARAKEVFLLDDDVDEMYREVQRRLLELLERGGETTQRLAFELLAARHLERVADNACKIAEKAVYAITGERRTEYFPALAHRSDGAERSG